MSFDRYEFLDRVLAKAVNRQAILNHLGLPSSRGPELFNRDAEKPRKLGLEEAIALSEAYGVPLMGDLASAAALVPILTVCLRGAPREWTDPEIAKLAGEIELGLRLHHEMARPVEAMEEERDDAQACSG